MPKHVLDYKQGQKPELQLISTLVSKTVYLRNSKCNTSFMFQNSAKVYEYLYSHLGSYSLMEFLMLPEWKKLLKVNAIFTNNCT